MKIYIIDDEKSSCQLLEYELLQIDKDIGEIKYFTNPKQGVKMLNSDPPDVLFIDIEMPQLSGFDVLDLVEHKEDISIVFITAYNQYAIKAFRYYAVDYLLKPVERNLLMEVVEKIDHKNRTLSEDEFKSIKDIAQQKISLDEKIVVPSSEGYKILPVKHIIKCESDNNYTTIYLTDGKKIVVSKSLKVFENELGDKGFFRVHQSFLINATMISEYIRKDGGSITLIDGSKVAVSRTIKKQINDFFRNRTI